MNNSNIILSIVEDDKNISINKVIIFPNFQKSNEYNAIEEKQPNIINKESEKNICEDNSLNDVINHFKTSLSTFYGNVMYCDSDKDKVNAIQSNRMNKCGKVICHICKKTINKRTSIKKIFICETCQKMINSNNHLPQLGKLKCSRCRHMKNLSEFLKNSGRSGYYFTKTCNGCLTTQKIKMSNKEKDK